MTRPSGPARAQLRAVTVVVALVATTVVSLLVVAGRGPERPAAGGVLTPDWAPPPVTTLAQATPRPLREATPGALLELLVRLLPPGQVSAPSRIAGAGRHVFLRFTRGGTDSYVTVGLSATDPGTPGRGCAAPPAGARCTVLPNGAVVLLHGDTGCASRTRAQVHRRDGVLVEVTVGTCTSHRLPARPAVPPVAGAGRGPLGPQEAQLIAADDLWGTFLRPEFVAAGNRHHPAPPELPRR